VLDLGHSFPSIATCCKVYPDRSAAILAARGLTLADP
jgi:hypothetical protein